MKEIQIQRSSILTFFTNSENSGGLGYKEVNNNQVRKDWFIQEDILEFLKTSNNINQYKEILKKEYNNNEKKFIEDYILELKREILKHPNIAIFFKKNYNSFKFKNKRFNLFYTNTSLLNNNNYKENIFSVVEELTYSFPYKNPKTNQYIRFRPDLVFFLNGIYINYNELKLNSQGQSSSIQGINKISNDYKIPFNILKDIYEKEKCSKKEKEQLKKELFWIFDKAIHISTCDINSIYLIRNIKDSFKLLEKDNLEEYKNFMNKNISIYPSKKDNEEMFAKDYTYKDYYKMLFSKDNITKEILYYNFIEKENKKDKTFVPRNKQKYGVDITIKRINEFVQNENNNNFELDELQKKLKQTKMSEAQQKEIIKERKKILNNKNINSLLLNYAAGFGKTDIIGLLALQIKDMTDENNNSIFNKIILVSDRIELREQISNKLFSMTGKKNNIQEAYNKTSFQKALKESRIIIVNIQKFPNIKDIISNEIKEELNKNRTIFIIDEIHRSNSNIQHEEMTTLFEEINNSFNNEEFNKSKRKNIVIGLTATANQFALQRFGEYVGCNSNGEIIYAPFDLYTMKQAIEDGFVLDFSKNIFGVPSSMYYEISEEDKIKLLNNKDEVQIESIKRKIYEDENRIKAISKNIIEKFIKTTFPAIKKQKKGTIGKGMIAAYSKKAATLYDKWIRFYLKEELKKDKYKNIEFNNMKNAEIYTIYSYSKDEDITIKNPIDLNNGLKEKEVIKKFKEAKNAIIIVVDKLQTGFNEPTLHTLVLDKEIKDINAIQTPARVNRVYPGKKDCLILDYSISLEINKQKKINLKKVINKDSKLEEEINLKEYINQNIEIYNFQYISHSNIEYIYKEGYFYKKNKGKEEKTEFKKGRILKEKEKYILKLYDSDKDIYSPNAQKNIPEAMEKYKDTQISNYTFIEPLKKLNSKYAEILKDEIKNEFYAEFKKIFNKNNLKIKDKISSEDSDDFLNLSKNIIKYLKENCENNENVYKLYVSYMSLLNKLELTVDFTDKDMKKYKKKELLSFLSVVKNLYLTNCKTKKEIIECHVEYDEKTGIIETSLINYEKNKIKEKPPKADSKIKSKYSVVDKIFYLNEKEENKEEKIKEWEIKENQFLSLIKEISIKDDEKLINKIESNLMEQAEKIFFKIYKKIKRRYKHKFSEDFFKQIDKMENEIWIDFVEEIINKKQYI